MTEEQFREFTEEVIPQQLFHVYPTDTDDKTGGRLDETILVGLIANRPTCLKHKPLQWFLDTYLISEEKWDEMMKNNLTENQKEEQKLFHQILEDERNENEKLPPVDNRTYDEKIAAWDDAGCSTGLNDD